MALGPDPAFRPAVELADAIRRRELGSAELLDHYLARVERLNPPLNAVVTLDVARARECARAADAALARGDLRGPLHGVPVTVKDTFETAGLRTTSGAPALADHVPAADAVAVERLRAAGAVVFGKTNTPVFAGDTQTYNRVFGTTNNPWDRTRAPGGSSGGSAAALAAGLTGLELGSDIGGSIRNPAHSCGVYGHKPSYGIVPIRGHIPGPPGTLAETDLGVAGPLARSADDLALALDILAGPDTERGTAWRLALPPPRRTALREYRFAAWLDDPACPVDAEVGERLAAVVAALRRAGATVDERARPAIALADAYRIYMRLLWPIMAAALPREERDQLDLLADRLAPDDESELARFARFATARHRDWLEASETRAQYRARWAEFFRQHDVLLCPVMPLPALPHDQTEPLTARTIRVNGATRPYLDVIVWNGAIGNLCYLPATVAPAGRTRGGLPVGIQIVGPYLEDRTPIDVARGMAEVVGGFERPPGY
jgi:amidase